MRWKELGRSKNVEHRRGGKSGGGRPIAMGGGLGTIIIALIAIFVFDVDPSKFFSQGVGSQQQTQSSSAKEAETEEFITAIKNSTEEVWTDLFAQNRKRYRVPKMVDYDVMTSLKTGGTADARMGPFYLPAEETIYLDTAFFDQMKNQFNAGGDFAYAYVIAHEVGHHVQKLLGRTEYVHSKKGRISDREYNRLSVKLELQADFLAGVWAHHGNKRMMAEKGFALLEEGDINEAMNAAEAIGDDALQRKAGGQVVEDSFTHGTSAQRRRRFLKGLKTGDLLQGDTFAIPYDNL
jgi:predicted metalloprotease